MKTENSERPVEMELEELRAEIDAIDDEILTLLTRRTDTAARIANAKKRIGRAVFDPARERAVLERLMELAREDLRDDVPALFSVLFSLSRSRQNVRIKSGEEETISQIIHKSETRIKLPQNALVACQGLPGAYSQMACTRLFEAPEILYFRSFEAVFKSVEQKLCHYGILPIENSSYGSVTQVYDLMKRHKFYIVKSLRLKIEHCLLAAAGAKIAGIKEIFSHEQALGQCGELLKKLGGDRLKITVCENTAAAACLVAKSGRNDAAAIASQGCAALYGLQVHKKNVQDADGNYTRFICIARAPQLLPHAARVSLMLSVPHRTGALLEVLLRVAACGINLLKLESRPILGSAFEFMFYFDLEADPCDPRVLRLLDQLETDAQKLVFLGGYCEEEGES
jgi:chorismate mutase/prephenate dehydratase